MPELSAVFYFLSQHSVICLPLFVLAGFAVGALLARWRKHGAWYGLGGVFFFLGVINIFAGSMLNAIFLNAFGTYGSAVITHGEETSSQLNDRNIWAYDAVMKTAEGRDVKIGFDTMSASLYPVRNEIDIPPVGERFVIKYIPGFERNVAIMRDESPFGKRLLVQEARGPVDRAAAQVAASPNNEEFRKEYREELQRFLRDHQADAPSDLIALYRSELQGLNPRGASAAR